MIDYTITIGNIVEIGSILLGGIAVLWTLKSDVKTLKRDFVAIQDEIKKLGDILVNLADIRGDIKALSARVSMAEQDIREMKHGDGFVKGPRGVDREYK
jgi:hypothetical protein